MTDAWSGDPAETVFPHGAPRPKLGDGVRHELGDNGQDAAVETPPAGPMKQQRRLDTAPREVSADDVAATLPASIDPR